MDVVLVVSEVDVVVVDVVDDNVAVVDVVVVDVAVELVTNDVVVSALCVEDKFAISFSAIPGTRARISPTSQEVKETTEELEGESRDAAFLK